MKKRILLIIVIALLIFTLTGCIPGDGTYTADKPAGFLWGIWHGWISPVSLIIGLFDKNIRVYEAVNTGWWYDFGFYIAIISGFGSLSLSRNKRSKKDD
ncbi:hypothetical protein EHE19_006845 [Ruminiclostridium herbifermentans]|uniref:Lipoprotein n=1 Tax=Ruminiclostridium herbifermentans TaxID=2488810 RepID=A0A4U7JAB6_9FIRM|nr:hypothetical protein [Ruminiclostridium herbifermentans]QNU68141.1 hypothetical protein EHE19_006845 [Ruminiclostridium herbifermentans]